MIITTMCENCCRTFEVIVDQKDYLEWESGEKDIQDAMDYLEKCERELLLSQTCDDCWKCLYGED